MFLADRTAVVISAARREENERVADALASPGDLNAIVDAFDAGQTNVTDISGLTISQREAILNSGAPDNRDSIAALSAMDRHMFIPGTSTLRTILSASDIVAPDSAKQETFFEEAQAFVKAGHPWATHFNNQFARSHGMELVEARQKRGLTEDRGQSAPELVSSFIDNYENRLAVGYYLAGRSLALELQAAEQWNKPLLAAKQKAAAQLRRLGPQMGLSLEHQDRTLDQLDRMTLGGYDKLELKRHFLFEAAAKYHPATLRMVVISGGSRTIPHELGHGASAQEFTTKVGRGGLAVARSRGFTNDGTEADEGMTEFLALDARGKTPRRSIGNVNFGNRSRAGHYTLFVGGMQRIRREDFATLYCAQYGQVDSKDKLLSALNAYSANLPA